MMLWTISSLFCRLSAKNNVSIEYLLTSILDAKNPIMSVYRYKELGFVTLEFRRREDAE
jgi:hypothetical protein